MKRVILIKTSLKKKKKKTDQEYRIYFSLYFIRNDKSLHTINDSDQSTVKCVLINVNWKIYLFTTKNKL